MNLETEKLEILQLILNTDKTELLMKIKALLIEDELDWWDQLSEEEKQEIEVGLQEAEFGKLIEHDKVMESFRKWKR